MKNIHKILILSLFFLPFYTFSEQQIASVTREKTPGFLYGVGLSVNKEIYKGYSSRTMPLPLIGYKGENLSIFGPFVSYKLKEVNRFTVSAKLSPRFQGFDESDSYIFKGMEKRKNSLDAGVSVDYQKNDWKIGISSMFDMLNRSNGFEIKSSFGRIYKFGPVFLEPSISLSLLDKDHVDYYYGVSKYEINQDRTVYSGKSALNKSAGLSIATPILFGGYTRLNIEYTWFDESITQSPLVDNETSINLLLLFTKNF
ncbi:MipA/OmpV family protein [Colwellia sp. MB02u-14]|uniref:MipA/OmpV family protein n=1 Tax=Colwellia sp. MB02u-14 TaxID=2759815 RepID=UPI0015F6A7CA|nr:MipA/OmpV family protein [Colwellia sp. MB02u-14]MBA6302412.1 MipA/OmpV family protein [Colwellia sp. MB02u-14]